MKPSRLLRNYISFTIPGKALDLACGNGRNSLFLAKNGFEVDAVDGSDVAIQTVKQMHPNIHAVCRDLDNWSIPPDRYDLIANIRYLNRHLFPGIQKGLKPGGLLIFQSFAGKPEDPYCLSENELKGSFPDLQTLFYEEKSIDPPGRFSITAALVAKKP